MEQETLAFEQKEHRAVQREKLVYQVIGGAMSALAERGLRYVALLATVALFSYSAYSATTDTARIVSGGLMASVFLFTLFRKGDE